MTSFPWPVPIPGDLRVRGGETDAATGRRVVEWFIERWAPGFTLPPESPLGEILASIEQMERGEAGRSFSSRDEKMAWEQRVLAFRRLDWGIRALHGRAGTLRDVHQSFVTKELAGSDSRAATWTMPSGIGTLYLAGRLLQTSGGQITIMGEGTAGHDIRWAPATGGDVLIERKDRAYDAATSDTLRNKVRHIATKISEAGKKFPRMPGTARVLAVGFPGYIPTNRANRIRRKMDDILGEILGPIANPDEHPDYVIIESLGSARTLTGGFEMTSFSNALDMGFERPEWTAVRDAFARSYTSSGRRLPGPWPIIW